jgi:hypothetical protein
MERTKWVDRTFTFDFPEGWIFNILERLKGTESRLRVMLAGIGDEDTAWQPGEKWSIRENVGHLYDIDLLHDGRLDDFMAGKEILRAADMTNALTNASKHNTRTLADLIHDFSVKRNGFITKIQRLDDTIHMQTALHPRLQVKMRPVDVAYFAAEHDDHHLASIREILEKYPG